jgi:uncharacterized membrane protein
MSIFGGFLVTVLFAEILTKNVEYLFPVKSFNNSVSQIAKRYLNKRILAILTLVPLFSSLIFVYAQDYTPSSLTVKVYSDGSTDLEYILEPDPTKARIEVSLFGENIQDFLVIDQDGVPLNWTLTSGGFRVDSLGSIELEIIYNTYSLTNKSGTNWSVSLDSPVNTVYILPMNAVLVGLDPQPIEISLIDSRVTVTMPNSTSVISYIIGTTGTRERALVLLNNAEEALNQAKSEAVIVTEAGELYEQAQEAYNQKNYSLSEELSQETIEKVKETEARAQQVQSQINETESLITELEGSVSQEDLENARSKLESAQADYIKGDYDLALSFAEEAYSIALNAEKVRVYDGSLVLIGVVVVVLIAGSLILWKLFSKPEKHIVDVDLYDLFEKNPSLRTDEKAVLRYVHESGGAFITSVRERFDIPKSSAWRMINRLEEAGLVETRIVGRETYIQIKED